MTEAKNPHILGEALSFKGDDEYEAPHNEVFEVTDVRDDGVVEIGWSEGKVRRYIRLSLGALVAKAAAFHAPAQE